MTVNALEAIGRFEVEGVPLNHPHKLLIQENIQNNDHHIQVFGAGLEGWEIENDRQVDNFNGFWKDPGLSSCQSYVLRIIVLPILTVAVFFSIIMDFISYKIRDWNSNSKDSYSDSIKLGNSNEINE